MGKLLAVLALLLSQGAAAATVLPFATPTTALTLTDVASGRVFQRSAGATSGSVYINGTYTGGACPLQAQIILNSNSAIVVNWTAATATFSNGVWSGSITTPQGPVAIPIADSYKVNVRCANKVSLTASGTTTFYVGRIVAMYGQSNMYYMSVTGSSPPAASAGTSYYNGSAFISVPAANGVREFLNALVAADGIPSMAFNDAVAGASMAALLLGAGTGYFETLSSHVTAVGGDFERMILAQGEDDANINTPTPTWISEFLTLQSQLLALNSRTYLQMPIFISGLGTKGVPGSGTDYWWNNQQQSILAAPASIPGVYYSHSNIDAARVDEYHYDGTGMGNAGKRFGRASSTYDGTTSGYPNWFITGGTVASATTTSFTVAENLGSNYTPTTSLTEFDVSQDNGANWVTPSNCVNSSATSILCTHSSLTQTSARIGRYMYGRLPTITGIVADNSTLALPLNPSANVVYLTGGTSIPVPKYSNTLRTTGTGAVYTAAGFQVGAAFSTRLAIAAIMYPGNDNAYSSAKFKCAGASDVAATLVKGANNSGSGQDRQITIIQGVIPGGAVCNVEVTYAGSIFVQNVIALWTVDTTTMNSSSAISTASHVDTGSTTSISTLNTTGGAGGFIIGSAINRNFAATTDVASGTETYVQRVNDNLGGPSAFVDASNIASNATNTITFTADQSGDMLSVAAAWR